MHKFLPYALFKGKCIPFKEAQLSIATHALHYGTAAFGGMRAIPDPQDENTTVNDNLFSMNGPLIYKMARKRVYKLIRTDLKNYSIYFQMIYYL